MHEVRGNNGWKKKEQIVKSELQRIQITDLSDIDYKVYIFKDLKEYVECMS